VRRETLALAVAIASFVAVLLPLTDGGIQLTRPLWVDEIHTVLIASRTSPADIIADLAAGADYGPPLLHSAMWVVRAVAGNLTPVVVRAFSLACVLGALVLLYRVVRRATGAAASAAGVLAVGSSTLVVTHAFDGRYYGPWLLCAAFFAWTLPSRDQPLTRARRAALGVAAVLLCLAHWYGVISLALMAAGAIASHGGQWRRGLRAVAPALAGIAALLACAPLLVGQRAALVSGTWVPDFSWGQSAALARLYWMGPALKVAAAVWLALAIVRRHPVLGATRSALRDAIREPGLAALLALAVLPIVLAVLTLAGAPSLVARYGVLSMLAWAPAVALVAQALGPRLAWVLGVGMAALWPAAFQADARTRRAFDRQVRGDLAVLDSAKRRVAGPVAYLSMHTLYASAWASPGDRGNLWYLDLPDDAIDRLFGPAARFHQLNKGIRVERDVVRIHARRFGFPRLLTPAMLDTAGPFALVTSPETLPRGWFRADSLARALLPGHRVTAAGAQLTLVERAKR